MWKLINSERERSSELDIRLKLAMVVGSDRLRKKLRKADADLELQFQQLANHLGEIPQQQQHAAAVPSGLIRDDVPLAPGMNKQFEEFKMTPQTQMDHRNGSDRRGHSPDIC